MRVRRTGLLLAAALAVALGIAPPLARPALAAGPLQLAADTEYTLDPEDGRVHVAIEVRATNRKPNTSTVIYWYRELPFVLQPDATAIRAADAEGGIGITARKRDGYIEATVRLRANLYFNRSTTFTIRYDLVGGAPRSDSAIRVGRAFATFGVWAWGDVGRSTVEVRTPPGFGSTMDGDPLQISNASTGQVLRAEPADPETFFAIVNASNPAAFGSTRVSLGDGVEIVVKAWPEDDEWDSTVSETLRSGLPALQDLIGLDWPVDHDLEVRERATTSLEGYAGFFLTDEQVIELGEDLDPFVILHEASHAWLNDALFVERWIYEGLADEYAWRADAENGGAAELPDRPDLDDPGFQRLATWAFPEAIRDQATDDTERYGYQAAFWVVHALVDEVGEGRMREAFANAQENRTAYPGAGAPETVAAADGWKRLLDLAQPLETPDSPAIEQALEDYVIGSSEARTLDVRQDARDRYRDLLEAGDGWAAPWYVRQPMGEWRFDLAETRMAEARAALDLRGRVLAAASAEGLTPDDALETAYEGATDGFGGATELGSDQLAALAAIAEARAKVKAPLDFVGQLGLTDVDPDAHHEAARTAFSEGRLDDAMAAAGAAVAAIAGAPAAGQQRLLTYGAVAAAVVLLLLVVVFMVARRRRRRRQALAGAAAGAITFEIATIEPGGTELPAVEAPAAEAPASEAPVAEPPAAEPHVAEPPPIEAATPEAYATLAADPAEVPAPPAMPPGDGPPDEEGGPRTR